jgi:predicted ATP-dependent serine protease
MHVITPKDSASPANMPIVCYHAHAHSVYTHTITHAQNDNHCCIRPHKRLLLLSQQQLKAALKKEHTAMSIISLRHGCHIHSVNVDPRLRTRIPTGVDFVDEALGHGGFVPSNVQMLTGDPGVGKTTMILQIANALHAAGHVCLLNTIEQAPENVQLMCERLALKHGFYIGNDQNAIKMIVNATAIMNSNPGKQFFLLIDSLPEMSMNDNGDCGNAISISVAKLVREWANKTFGIVIFINHVTKGGTFAGRNGILHQVDQHAQFMFDKEKRSPTFGERIFKISKNRWGCSGVTSILQMSETGLTQTGRLMVSE